MKQSVNHIAFIMDGNRRWATAAGMSKIKGHEYGLENFHRIIKSCDELGIQQVSVYAFSTENWNRSETEVKALMSIMSRLVQDEKHRLTESQRRIHFVGDLSRFDTRMCAAMKDIEKETGHLENDLFICLSYGGRLEIVESARQLAHSGQDFTLENFQKHLWSRDMSDIDLLIRTGGDYRLSNFLPWQLAYAELYFTDTLWPDFEQNELESILHNYGYAVRINHGV